MTTESLQPAPNPNQGEHGELDLQAGQRAFAQNILRVSEAGGVEAIQDYLGAVLADTDDRLLPGERQAAVSFLAQEQRAAIHSELIQSGNKMLESMAQANIEAKAPIEGGMRTLNHQTRQINETTQTVGRAVRNRDEKGAARKNEELGITVKRSHVSTEEYSQSVDRWGRLLADASQPFLRKFASGQKHMRALHEAVRTTEPDYDGEPMDLTKLIDTDVMLAAAGKLQEAAALDDTDGTTAEDRLIDVVATTPVNERNAGRLKHLIKLATEAPDQVGAQGERARSALVAHERQILSAVRRGSDIYGYARRPEDLDGAYRAQIRAITEAVGAIDTVIRQTPRLYQDINGRIQSLQSAARSIEQAM